VKASPAVAKSYAKALFALARERGQADAVGAELRALADLVSGDREASEFLAVPWVSADAKRAAAVELATRAEVAPLTRDFLGLVAAHGRADHLAAIADAYRDLGDAEANRARARVRTAVALTEADRATLAARLGRALGGKQVVIEEVVDPSLLGGFVAEIGSLVMDGSLDGQLARLRESLARG
jgi:F-type H+-transporting ATPase subunit delta